MIILKNKSFLTWIENLILFILNLDFIIWNCPQSTTEKLKMEFIFKN